MHRMAGAQNDNKNRIKMKHLGKQFITFSIVGTIATSVQYIILAILVELFHFQPVFSSSTGFIIGGIVSYSLNKKITFRSNKKHRIAMLQFCCVAAVAFWLNGIFMAIGTHHLHWNYFLVQIITTGIVLFWNFIANRFWTFKVKESI